MMVLSSGLSHLSLTALVTMSSECVLFQVQDLWPIFKVPFPLWVSLVDTSRVIALWGSDGSPVVFKGPLWKPEEGLKQYEIGGNLCLRSLNTCSSGVAL